MDTSVAGGKGYNDFATDFCAAKIRRQADGKFDVAGRVVVSGYGNAMSVQRIDADLTGLDVSFGSNGTAVVAFGVYGTTGNDVANALAIQSDGKIVVGGYVGDGEEKLGLCIGALASQRATRYQLRQWGRASALSRRQLRSEVFDLAIHSQQPVVFAGYMEESSEERRLVGRLTSVGKFDTTFGIAGIAEFPLANSGDAEVKSLTLSGQSIIIGSMVPGTSGHPNFSVSEITATGHLDASFGTNGTTSATFSPSDAYDFTWQCDRHGSRHRDYRRRSDQFQLRIRSCAPQL